MCFLKTVFVVMLSVVFFLCDFTVIDKCEIIGPLRHHLGLRAGSHTPDLLQLI